MGAELVQGYLDRGYGIVANTRFMKADGLADFPVVAGDIAEPAVAGRVINAAVD
jgi:hypothetical protein